MRWTALAALAGCGLCVPISAQSPDDGAIGGRLVTAVGAPVADAVVVARDEQTSVEERARTGAHGEFLLPRLPVGEYSVAIENGGAGDAQPVHVGLGEVTAIELHLATSGAASGLPSAPVPTEGARNVPAAELAELPVEGGQWRAAALTISDANAAASTDDDAGDISFRGVDLTQNSTRLDGIGSDEGFSGGRAGMGVAEDTDVGSDEVRDPASGPGSGTRSLAAGGQRAGSSYAFSGAAVREFRVGAQASAAQYGSALYGHGVGGVVTTVSRSGGSTLHGMAFYNVRDSAWSAMDPFALAQTYANGVTTSRLVRPEDMRQQFGGRIGGPLWESDESSKGAVGAARIFYFYAFDGERRNFPAISSPGYAGFYSLTPTQTALLANRGVSSTQTNAALNYLASLTGTVPRHEDQTVNFARMDWQRRSSQRVAVEYNRVRWSAPGGARTGAVVNRGLASFGSSYGDVDAGVARWTAFRGAGLSNELRAQVGRELKYETPETPLTQEPNIGPGGMPPEVSIGPDGFLFGTPAALGQRAYPDERRTEVADVLAWVRGRHFLQLGGDATWLSDETASLTNAEGTFNYDSGTSSGHAGGLVDWITDYSFGVNAYPNGACPSIFAPVHDFCFRSYSQSFGEESVSWKTREWAAFVQDDWRAASRLTLHLGVRYELQQLPIPQHPNAALDAIFGSAGATSAFPEDRNNFGPRIGLEWLPFGFGRGVLRAGFGVYYGKLPGATVRAALINTALPQSTVRVRITPTTETACPQMPSVGFGYPCSFLAQPSGVVAATTSAMVFDHRFRLPMVEEGTLELEHEVGGGVLGRIGYVMNLDRQLPNSVDINIAPSNSVAEFKLQGGTGAIGVRDGEVFYVPVYSTRVTSAYGPVTDIVSNANATYHGLTVEARRGLGSARSGYAGARGLDFRVSWTWSKAIDFGQNGGATPRANGQFDPFQVRYDKGLSALNFPHRVSATVVWSPRVMAAMENGGALPAAERAAWRLADGWSLGVIFYEASGRGYSYDVFGGRRLAGGRESINGSGGSVVLPTVGRNTLRLPDRLNLDLRISRSFRVWRDGVWLRAAIEGFNVMNHLNYSGIEQRAFLAGTPAAIGGSGPVLTPLVFQSPATVAAEGLNTPPFGAFTSARTSQAQERQIQMGLRLEF
ncbi:MAG TPA: TonB-dependent receptor [Acidobacteriaceae bacterium]|nr:TonB-dependent receptor [Acidobacteriaceae bacterium]